MRSVLLWARRERDLLVSAAEAMPLTQRDVGPVHRLDVGLRCHDNVVAEVSSAHPPPEKQLETRDRISKLTGNTDFLAAPEAELVLDEKFYRLRVSSRGIFRPQVAPV